MTITSSKTFRNICAISAGAATMAFAPAPVLANASSAATVEVTENAQSKGNEAQASEQRYRQLFADWKKHEGAGPKTVVFPGSSYESGTVNTGRSAVPSRMPVENARFSSNFGMRTHPVTGGRKMHSGIDIAASTGTPIYATADGTVEMAKWYGGYGNYVQIGHGGDFETRYGHMSRLNVRAGQNVRKGELIGWVGSTGRSTGPHLHYEVRIDGRAVNPEPYLSGDKFGEAFAHNGH